MTAFSSYDPREVTWLLTDLSEVALEVPTEDREELIQGGRHYAEMLPVEYQPDAAYTALFHEALQESAARLAEAVGLVGELLLDEHDGAPALVSLARAGTPIGILLRRWFATKGLDAPHYAISIVRGKGIDEVAVQHVLDRHAAADVRFVDGWTGKGAIARELAVAVARWPGLDPRLAVLADPGSCTDLYGTRDDFLIPSACLNSTVSGLVSRTVLRDDLIGPGMFHGAKHYADLAPADVSNEFLDAVSSTFAPVTVPDEDRTPTWEGW
ncbi:MAG: phosphoribosyltransferase, partial [Frankiales bacterium]|nr:phosphoribosyltransferase [Frankiales bacterium]